MAEQYGRDYGMTVDPETEVCVTCGSTEAMIASMLGVLDPGDEVVIFETYYEKTMSSNGKAARRFNLIVLVVACCSP
jgi:aspartate/methionine/tyrosine aminotransferase